MSNLNELEKNVPYFVEELKNHGLSNKNILDAAKRGQLKRMAHGLYQFNGVTLNWASLVFALQTQKKLPFHLAGYSALSAMGMGQYVSKRNLLFTHKASHLSSLGGVFDDYKLHFIQTNFLEDVKDGLRKLDVDGYQLTISTPERAFLECCFLVPIFLPVEDLWQLSENFKNLDWALLEKLVSLCRSQRVLRVAGYLLQTLYRDAPLGLIRKMRKKSGTYKFYLDEANKKHGRFVSDWNIIVPVTWHEAGEGTNEQLP